MENTFVEVKSNGVVSAKQGTNIRTPYDHQKKAMENLDIIDETPSYSTLVVLPTGGGKTYTASMWLLRHALNQHKKILFPRKPSYSVSFLHRIFLLSSPHTIILDLSD